MAYDRINWENAPSTETPLSAENLNTMDAKIAALDAQTEELSEKHDQLEDSVELLDRRMDTFASLPAGTTAGNAELIDARTINGTTYNTLGGALNTEFSGVKSRVTDLETGVSNLSDDISAETARAIEQLAPPFEPLATYKPGDYCSNDGNVYRSYDSVNSPGFNPSEWEHIISITDITEELSNLMARRPSTSSTIVPGQYFMYMNKLCYFNKNYNYDGNTIPLGTYNSTSDIGQVLLNLARSFVNVYVEGNAYAIGSYAMDNGRLYECIRPIAQGENYPPDRYSSSYYPPQYWKRLNVLDIIDTINTAISDLEDQLSNKITIEGTKMVIHA